MLTNLQFKFVEMLSVPEMQGCRKVPMLLAFLLYGALPSYNCMFPFPAALPFCLDVSNRVAFAPIVTRTGFVPRSISLYAVGCTVFSSTGYPS